jgi:DNA replication protein
MQYRDTNDLLRIAAAGGGLELEGSLRPTNDLVRIAAACAKGGGTLILRGMSLKPTEDLLRIAAASKGKVIFSN